MPVTPSARRWARGFAAALLAGAAACQPRQPVATAPVPAPPAGPTIPDDPRRPPPPPPAASAFAPPVKVGLAVDTPSVRVGSDWAFGVRTQEGRQVARLEPGDSVRFTLHGGTVTMEATPRGGGRPRVHQGLEVPLVVHPLTEGVLSTGGRRYRGALVVQKSPGGELTLVNQLDMESYLLGVVPREIGRVGPELLEAAKAQAVAARTYAVRYMGRRAAQGFDVFPTTDDQVYGGVADEAEPVSQAVRETAGEILTYGGEPILAYYHSTCAGQTAAIEEVWNDAPAPYLVSVRDVDPQGQAYDRTSSRFTWTERWTHEQLVGILNRTMADSLRGRRITQIRDMRVLERTPSGRIRAMRLETDAGTFTLGKDRVRWILTPASRAGILNSSKFDVRLERSGGQVTAIVAEGGGWGHGIGMCQVGAMGRAKAGQDYRTILRTYYPGTEIRDMY